MTILFVLVPMAAVLAILAAGAFVWSVRQGQLDDLETPALRILNDDDSPPRHPETPPSSRRSGD